MSNKLIRRVGWRVVPTITHWCPACKEPHDFAVDQPFNNGAKWSFDGDVDRPTFSPSMNVRTGPMPDGHLDVCHYFLKEGRIQFLGDCTHDMKGQTVDLPDLPFRKDGAYTWLGSTLVDGVK